MANRLRTYSSRESLRPVSEQHVHKVLAWEGVDLEQVDHIVYRERAHVWMKGDDFPRYAVFSSLGFEEQDPPASTDR